MSKRCNRRPRHRTRPNTTRHQVHDSSVKPIDRETYKELMHLFASRLEFWGPHEVPELLRG